MLGFAYKFRFNPNGQRDSLTICSTFISGGAILITNQKLLPRFLFGFCCLSSPNNIASMQKADKFHLGTTPSHFIYKQPVNFFRIGYSEFMTFFDSEGAAFCLGIK